MDVCIESSLRSTLIGKGLHKMQLETKDIESFKELCLKEYGKGLTDEEAEEELILLR